MNYRDVLEALRERSGGGSIYTLDRMALLLDALGHPERRYPTWLVAGTNGKGSVAAMLEAIAREAGLRTGLNTSPHLNRLSERIRVGGDELREPELVVLFERVEAARRSAGIDITFFETVTAMAMLGFAEHGVTRGVFEVGLGGRLDATNLLDPQVSAVVSIDLDHVGILGETRDRIAREKAAIARRGRPLVLGLLGAEAMTASLEVAARIGARVVQAETHLRDLQHDAPRIEHPLGCVALQPALQGPHQLANAAVAALVALESGLPAELIARGIAATRWKGRMERVDRGGRPYLLDCAHNEAGALALGHALHGQVHGYELVLATSGGRDTAAFVRALARGLGWPAAVQTCQPSGHRLIPATEVRDRVSQALPPGIDIATAASVPQALERAPRAPLCLVTGSIFLVAEALAELRGEAQDPFATGR
ncbi:MAG: Mur ligase family protein [Pseudomonadota bacterium]